MTIFAKIVSFILLLCGVIAVAIGVYGLTAQGTDNQLGSSLSLFSGLLIIAAGLGLYLLAIIAREPEERWAQECWQSKPKAPVMPHDGRLVD